MRRILKKSRSLAAKIVVLLTVTTAAVMVPTPAVAQSKLRETVSNPGAYDPVPNGGSEYVAFGDSFAANPTYWDQVEPREDNALCRWSKNSYPVQLKPNFSSTFIATCAGSVIEKDAGPVQTSNLIDRVRYAERAGALGPGTKIVTITAGANEAWDGIIRDYGVLQSWRRITPAEYGRRIGPSVRRIHELAPNARVLLVGYPHVVDSDRRLCAINMPKERIGVPVRVVVPDRVMVDYLGTINESMRELGAELHTEFVDIAAGFEGHGSCQPLEQRWVKNIIDDQAQDQIMAWHLTERGVAAQASMIMERVHRR